jgi:AraC-like DNA-binding protein
MSGDPPVDSSAQVCADFVCATHADQRRALAELFARQLAATPVERVHFAFEHQRPAQGATVTHVPRLSLPLAGRHPFELNLGDGAEVLRLAPREALFMLPGSWRRALFDETRTHTAIVFEQDLIWFFAQHCAPMAPVQPQLWFHTAQPIVPEGLDLIHALSAMARSGRNLELAPALVRSLVQIAHAQLADSAAGARDAGEAMWQGMCAYIRERYHHTLDRDALAAAFDVHPNHVSRLFRRHGGEGFNRYLVRTRLEHATRLLRTSNCTIEEVALRTGFNDDNYFRHTFRRFFGMAPRQFRESGGR